MDIIQLENIEYYYNRGMPDEVKAIDDISLSIAQGQIIALVGRNGSGKSTIARLLNGLLLPCKGAVKVNGIYTHDKSNILEIRKSLGVVFQNPESQTVATIIEDDVAFGPENIGLPPKEIRERVDWALNAVGLYEYRESTATRLSGGQKQRLAIAGVLALLPKIMVLDEATSMLDPIGRREVLSIIKKLNSEHKMTVIMITHYMEESLLADRIIVLDGGKVVLDGDQNIFTSDCSVITNAGLMLPFNQRISAKLKQRGVELCL